MSPPFRVAKRHKPARAGRHDQFVSERAAAPGIALLLDADGHGLHRRRRLGKSEDDRGKDHVHLLICRQRPAAKLPASPAEQQQQLHVHGAAVRPLGRREARDLRDRHVVDDDLLALHAAAFADPNQPLGAQQGEAFRRHAGRGVEAAQIHHPLGAVAGFLLQLAYRGALDLLAFLLSPIRPAGSSRQLVPIGRDIARPGPPVSSWMPGSRPRRYCGCARHIPICRGAWRR
jgi:hypothetical protein